MLIAMAALLLTGCSKKASGEAPAAADTTAVEQPVADTTIAVSAAASAPQPAANLTPAHDVAQGAPAQQQARQLNVQPGTPKGKTVKVDTATVRALQAQKAELEAQLKAIEKAKGDKEAEERELRKLKQMVDPSAAK